MKSPPWDLDIGDPPRWTFGRKLAVLEAIAQRKISKAEACARWAISPEELEEWQRNWKRYGPQGLKATKLQKFRLTPPAGSRRAPP